MNKNETKKDWTQFSTSLPNKFIKLLKLHAYKDDITMSEILVRYQKTYIEIKEWEKQEPKQEKKNSLGMDGKELWEMYRLSFKRELDNEKAENLKVPCSSCKTSDYPCRMWKVSEELYYCYPCWRQIKSK